MSEEQHGGLFGEDPQLAYAVGTGETALREQMGNEQFEAYIEWVAKNRTVSLAHDASNATRINAIATCWQTFNALMPLMFLLVAVASIFAMVMWAVL